MSGKPKPMSPVDAGWFHMDGATNLAMVAGVTLTKEPLDFARLKEIYAHRILQFDRFRQRVVETGRPFPTPHWEDDPYFNIDDHIHHVALPEPCDKRALLDLLSDLASTPLDYKRPLWQVHVVDKVDGGSAMVLRFHHCIGDGTGMMAVAQWLFDTDPDAPLDRPIPDLRPPKAGLFDRYVRPTQRIVQSGADMALHPSHAMELTQLAARGVGVAVGTLLKTPDPASPLKGRLGIAKRVAWSEPVALDDVKAIGKQTGAKVNDVLVAAMAGALRHYMQARRAKVDGLTIRAVVPVDLRPPDRALELGNHFGLTFLDLPVGVPGPMERLKITKANMDGIKESPEAAVFMNIIGIFGQTPKPLEDIAVAIFGTKATLVFTNVAGPRQPLYLAGSAVDRMIFWVPHPGNLAMGISIFSYDNKVTLGIVADAGLVPNPERITTEFGQEFTRMLAATRSTKKARPKAGAQIAQCAATTSAGSPCKNRPLAGSPYCRVHQSKGAGA